MANTHATLASLFSDIADAIRAKTGGTAEIVADTFPEAIQAIPTGETPTGSISITENGTHDVAAYAIANVNVQPDLETKSLTVTENGTQTIAPSAGKDGLSSVALTVNVQGGGGATEPYTEETYNISGKLTSAVMYGNAYIRDYAFYTCSTLTSVTFSDNLINIGSNAFMSDTGLTELSLPNSLETIYSNAFRGCTGLTELTIPANVSSVQSASFYGCTGLETATFLGKPRTITNNIFSNDDALTDIYVPWAEGEVSNAPWGATNATVHYNS